MVTVLERQTSGEADILYYDALGAILICNLRQSSVSRGLLAYSFFLKILSPHQAFRAC